MLNFPNNPQEGDIYQNWQFLSGRWLGTSADTGDGGIPEAPTDGQAYGRSSSAWSPVLKLSGGTLTGALVSTYTGPSPGLMLEGSYNQTLGSDTGWGVMGEPAMIVALDGPRNGIVGYVYMNAAPGTVSYPAAVNGYGKLAASSTGNTVFGMFALAEMYPVGGGMGIGQEITVRNYAGSPDIALPPNLTFGTTTRVANGLQITAGGDYDASIGIMVSQEGGGTRQYNTAQYLWHFRQYGLYIEAQASGSQTNIYSRGNGNGAQLVLKTTTAAQVTNPVIRLLDSANVEKFVVRQDGRIINAGGADLSQDISVRFADSAAYQALFAGTTNAVRVLTTATEARVEAVKPDITGYVPLQLGGTTINLAATDVFAPTPTTGDNSTRIATTAWVRAQSYGAGGGGISSLTGDVTASGTGAVAASVVRLQGQPVSATAPTGTQVLQWNGSAWAPTTLAGGGSVSLTAGTGLTASPSTITGTGSLSLTIPVGITSGGTGATTAPLARAALGVPAITVADVAPTSPAVGDLWLDGVSMQLYCWVNDGSSSQWIVCNNPQSAAKAYTVGFSYIGGTLGASQLIGLHKFAKAVSFAPNFGAYAGYAPEAGATANATASTIISVERAVAATPNTFVQIGTITFAAGTITPTFTSGAVSCAQGDVLRLVGPSTPDASLANPYFTLVAAEA